VSTVSFVAAGLFLGIGVISTLASPSSHGAAPKRSNVGFTLRGLDGTF
jgi:hypothetical protein